MIAVATFYLQATDPAFRAPILGVALYYAITILYFALIGRHGLVLSPEEAFALTRGLAEQRGH